METNFTSTIREKYNGLVDEITELADYINLSTTDEIGDLDENKKELSAYEAYDIAIKTILLFKKLNK